MICRLVKGVTEPKAGQGWHERREAGCTVSRNEEQGLYFKGTHIYMEAEDWVSSWRFTLGSDRRTAGVTLRKGLFLQMLLAASLTAHALIANK